MGRENMRLQEYCEKLFEKLFNKTNGVEKYENENDENLTNLFSKEMFFGVYNNTRHDNNLKNDNYQKTETKLFTIYGSEVNISLTKLSESADFIKKTSKYQTFVETREKLFAKLEKNSIIGIINEGHIDRYLNAYQNLLIYILHHLSDCKLDREKAEIKQFLSKFMLIDCVKDYKENEIYISKLNPLMLVQAKRFYALKDVVINSGIQNYFRDDKKDIFPKLLATIMEKQFPSRVYSDIVIYTIDKRNCDLGKSGFQVAKLRRTMSTLNSINSIRIIGKILRSLADGENKKLFKIAYFGEFCDKKEELNVVKYFQLSEVNDEYNNKLPKFEIDQYILAHTAKDNLLYHKKQDRGSDQEYYDLQEMGSLRDLMKSYDLILFLDEGYYYKKEHQNKNIEFDNLHAVLSYTMHKKAKISNCYLKWDALTALMNWGFSFWGDKSGYYKFDENLYENICNISNICNNNLNQEQFSNTYVYISEGKKVGEIDLTKSNVCEEELYYGHKMTVSHFPKKTKLEGFRSLLSNKSPAFKLQIEAWKLLRSLFDETYDYLYKKLFSSEMTNEGESLLMIYYLKHIAIVWDYREIVQNLEKPCIIHLEICPLESDKVWNALNEKGFEYLAEFISSLFKIAFWEKSNIVSQYVREVILETSKASAYRIEDFLFVNFLKYFNKKCEVDYKCVKINKKEEFHLSTQTRQSIHAIVEQLDNLHIREVLQNGFYIKRDIIRDIEGHGNSLSVKQFDGILKKMKDIQDGGFNSNSLLKHNINILCPKQEEEYDE